jgi:hypothetical protein
MTRKLIMIDLAKRIISTILMAAMLLLATTPSAQARFLSPDTFDPWEQGVDINRYAYSGNDPINGSDPNGHDTIGHNGGPPLIDIDEPEGFIERRNDLPAMTRQEQQFNRMIKYMVEGAAGTMIMAVDQRNRDISAADIRREAQRAQLRVNASVGAQREKDFVAELRVKFPGSVIQTQRTLRDRNGNIVRDPKTGEARRVDVVVIRGRTGIAFEVTSPTADKRIQTAKDVRIRDAGGNYFRDRATGAVRRVDRTRTERRR